MDPEKAFQIRSAAVWAAVIAALHFALGTRTHSFHGLHLLLAGLFMVPVLKAAVAFEVRGGVIAAAAVGTLYLAHVLWSWRNSALANADQYAMIGVYFVVGISAGHLVKTANFHKWQRDEVIRRSQPTPPSTPPSTPPFTPMSPAAPAAPAIPAGGMKDMR